ncbi:hypothetical protein HGG73_07540 [Rhodobacteraceae bacterium R_SAG3]|nr:hypothetical protein [Rhodobacteraceae bacterium R_SAG3]
MKVILYIGHHKVGSTSLQSFLAQNCLTLLKQGILYPAVESQGMAHLLRQLLHPQISPDLGCMNLREPHNALAFRMLSPKNNAAIPKWHTSLPGLVAMERTIRHQVEVFQPSTVILCSEVFSNFGNGHADLVTRLQSLFPNEEFEIYCVLRRPDDYLTSWFGQRLRFGHRMPPLSAQDGINFHNIHFDYQKMLTPWVERFHDSRIHLRNYTAVLQAGGSVADFTATVDCQFPSGLAQPGRKNVSLPRASFEILRRGNKMLPSAQAELLRKVFEKLPLPGINDSQIEVFGEQQRRRIANKFERIQGYLSQLVPSSQGFFPDLEEMRTVNPLPLKEATRKILSFTPLGLLPNKELRTFFATLKKTL